MSGQTISVDLDAISGSTGPQPAESHGVNLIISASAFDVPRSVKIEIGPECMTLTFEYLDHEDEEEVVVDPNLIFAVGKNSGKLLKISAKGDGLQHIPRILGGIEKARGSAKRDNQKLNYGIIKELLARQIQGVLAGNMNY
jgi:hypothetical protein